MTDRQIIRELAKQYAFIASKPENTERRERAYKTNSLQAVRPLVWISEIPWSEFDNDDALRPVCEDPFARGIEIRLRRTIFQWNHFRADMIVENEFAIPRAFDESSIGINVMESLLATDNRNNIVSHKYTDQLDTPEKVNALKAPVITPRPDLDIKNLERTQELLGDILPVKIRGGYCYSSIWDNIATYRGMTNLLTDLALEPELMHLTAEKLYELKSERISQLSRYRMYSSFVPDLHCTPGYCRELEEKGAKDEGISECSWLRAMAQPFASVSAKMHDEFDIRYLLSLSKRFGLVYYGCCEQLSDRLDVIKKIPNLRKVGVSPWSDVEVSAEQLGKNYVFSRKPNPAYVQGTFDADIVSAETEKTVKACIRYGCPCDIALKDISSVGRNYRNLTYWAETVEKVLNKYY